MSKTAPDPSVWGIILGPTPCRRTRGTLGRNNRTLWKPVFVTRSMNSTSNHGQNLVVSCVGSHSQDGPAIRYFDTARSPIQGNPLPGCQFSLNQAKWQNTPNVMGGAGESRGTLDVNTHVRRRRMVFSNFTHASNLTSTRHNNHRLHGAPRNAIPTSVIVDSIPFEQQIRAGGQASCWTSVVRLSTALASLALEVSTNGVPTRRLTTT